MIKQKACDRLRTQLHGLDAALITTEARATAAPMARKSIEPGTDRSWGYPPA